MLSQRLLEEVKKITYLIYLNNLWLSIAQVRHLQYNRKRKENTRGLVTALAARPVLARYVDRVSLEILKASYPGSYRVINIVYSQCKDGRQSTVE